MFENSDVISTTFKSWLVLEGVSECEHKHFKNCIRFIKSRFASTRRPFSRAYYLAANKLADAPCPDLPCLIIETEKYRPTVYVRPFEKAKFAHYSS